MHGELRSLVDSLLESSHFDDAAEATLQAMLRIAEEALAASSYASHGRILRGLIHLRPGEGYRGLAVVELPDARGSAAPGGADRPLRMSATAWRLVVEHRCAISIDIAQGSVWPHRPNATKVESVKVGGPGERFSHSESRQHFLGRQATHVCVLPLRSPRGGIDGMITLEANCLAALGQEFIWRGCGELLQLVADVAAPYLGSLPLRPALPAAGDEFLPVIGGTMSRLIPILRVFAQEDETLLISGPTGAGKSRLARWCHEHSSRRQDPFEVLDLMTVPEDLQMAALFGWRRGAFTGATRDSQGSVARAEGGTLFIDEIDKLSLKAQAGLLHVLEERTYRILGDGETERKANVRFIIGTNAQLHEAVREGRFREDLYYRINVLPFAVPPLEERLDEIPQWAYYMLTRRHRERIPDGQAHVSAEAERRLRASRWPGNLRQLDNIVRRAYMFALATRGGARDVTLEEAHVEQALAYERVSEQAPLMGALHAAALAFFNEARRQEGRLELELADAFRGLILGVAVRQLGRDDAFRLFGYDRMVKGRNHHRVLHRDLEKVEALCKAIGLERSPLADLLTGEEEPR